HDKHHDDAHPGLPGYAETRALTQLVPEKRDEDGQEEQQDDPGHGRLLKWRNCSRSRLRYRPGGQPDPDPGALPWRRGQVGVTVVGDRDGLHDRQPESTAALRFGSVRRGATVPAAPVEPVEGPGRVVGAHA